MIQNIVALTIVFAVLIYSVVTLYRNVTSKKQNKCSGCCGCEFKKPS